MRPVAEGVASQEAVTPAEAPDDYVRVPRYDLQASAGGGAVIHSEQVVDTLAFKADWVRVEMGLQPERLALVSVRGDSMEPTLRAGDLVLVDLRQAEPGDGLYLVRRDHELLAKRLQRGPGGQLQIRSDNSAYATITVGPDEAADLQVLGRIVWQGRKVG